MPNFTLLLNEVIEITGGTTELVNGVTKMTGGNIGLNYYPIFDEAYRDSLTGRIIDHYWNREIGLETISMFQMNMRKKMNEIMPYYNKLYLSTQLEIDPLKTVDLSTISHGTGEQTGTQTANGTNNSTNTAKSRAVNSDTPQTMLSDNEDYATAGVDSNSQSTVEGTNEQSGNTTENSTTDSTVTSSGYQGVPGTLITMYRDSLINVDLMVIGELEELFMQVWDTGDTYTNRNGYML